MTRSHSRQSILPTPLFAAILLVTLSAAAQAQWNLREDRDPVTNRTLREGSVPSAPLLVQRPRQQGVARGAVTMRKIGNDATSIGFVVTNGRLICPGTCTLKVRFNDGPLQDVKAQSISDASESVVSFAAPEALLPGLRQAQRLRVQAWLLGDERVDFDFDVRGLRWD